MITRDINILWEEGIEHDPRAERLARFIGELDYTYGGDALCLKFGGDGDNGEHLAYMLDLYFRAIDAKEAILPENNEPIPEYSDHMTSADFAEQVGLTFVDSDGYGHYASATEMFDEEFSPSTFNPSRATHVVWFNK